METLVLTAKIDGADTLGGVLADAGYPGVDDETELQLEFAEAESSPDGE